MCSKYNINISRITNTMGCKKYIQLMLLGLNRCELWSFITNMMMIDANKISSVLSYYIKNDLWLDAHK